MNKTDRQRIEHILGYCCDIAVFIERFGKDYDSFLADKAYYNAVSMCIMQIGELANGLSEEFREKTKEQMPWGKIRGMRNWVAHAYLEMDSSVIWETANNRIPELAVFCEKFLTQNLEKPSILAILRQEKPVEKTGRKKW